MSLRDELLEKAELLYNNKAPGWLDKAEAEAREALPDITAEANDLLVAAGLNPIGTEYAGEVLDELAAGKKPLLRVGSVGFAWLVANLESGEEAEARRLYLSTEATFDERRTAMQAAGDSAFDEAKERAEAWEEFLAVLESIGKVGLKVLVAVARKAVGL